MLKFFGLARRLLNAASMRVYFPGTRRFQLPKWFILNNQQISLSAPDEAGLAYDFINVLLDDEYGLREIVPPPLTVLDIGANIGLFSLWAKSRFPFAKIHAYEPNSKITPFTQKNLEQCNITLFKEAVGAESGFASIKDNCESRLCQFTPGGAEGVAVISLEEAIERLGGSIDLLKLDCEGAEWDIFMNPAPFTKVKLVRMEYHLTGGRTVESLKSVVKNLGFVVDHIEENSGFGIIWLSRLQK